jgi:hypothetical protein
MPHRQFATPEELRSALGDVSQIIIDVTERNFRRSQDDEQPQEYYSGKKRHTVKQKQSRPSVD